MKRLVSFVTVLALSLACIFSASAVDGEVFPDDGGAGEPSLFQDNTSDIESQDVPSSISIPASDLVEVFPSTYSDYLTFLGWGKTSNMSSFTYGVRYSSQSTFGYSWSQSVGPSELFGCIFHNTSFSLRFTASFSSATTRNCIIYQRSDYSKNFYYDCFFVSSSGSSSSYLEYDGSPDSSLTFLIPSGAYLLIGAKSPFSSSASTSIDFQRLSFSVNPLVPSTDSLSPNSTGFSWAGSDGTFSDALYYIASRLDTIISKLTTISDTLSSIFSKLSDIRTFMSTLNVSINSGNRDVVSAINALSTTLSTPSAMDKFQQEYLDKQQSNLDIVEDMLDPQKNESMPDGGAAQFTQDLTKSFVGKSSQNFSMDKFNQVNDTFNSSLSDTSKDDSVFHFFSAETASEMETVAPMDEDGIIYDSDSVDAWAAEIQRRLGIWSTP